MIKKAFAKWFGRASSKNTLNKQFDLAFDAALEKALKTTIWKHITWSSVYEDEGIPNWVPVWCYRVWRHYVPFNPHAIKLGHRDLAQTLAAKKAERETETNE